MKSLEYPPNTKLWGDIRKGNKLVMWCDRLREKQNLEFESAHPPKKRQE